MNLAVAERLLDLNRKFYAERGRDFSETRRRLQPGVARVLDKLKGDETILDLGCGNGAVARALSKRGHRGAYVGIDSSGPLLDEANRAGYELPVRFVRTELVPVRDDSSDTVETPARHGLTARAEGWLEGNEQFSIVLAFAVLHHIPGRDLRLSLLRRILHYLEIDGTFIQSNWQFTRNPRLKARIQAWTSVGLRDSEIDDGDHLLDWRQGGPALRYVHEFSEMELVHLAAGSGFEVVETFYSDGDDHRSGLYQVWRPLGASHEAK